MTDLFGAAVWLRQRLPSPADFRTTAMLRPRILHFHTDLVGAPQEVTDKDGELV